MVWIVLAHGLPIMNNRANKTGQGELVMSSKRISSFTKVFAVFFFPVLGLDFLLFQFALNWHHVFNSIAIIAFLAALIRALVVSLRPNPNS